MDTEERDLKMANPAWADAMNKILKTKKRCKKSLVLSKAKLISNHHVSKIKEEVDNTDAFEVVNEEGEKIVQSFDSEDIKEEKPDLDNLEPRIPKRIRIKEQVLMGRMKPSVTDRVKEKNLSKIATKGVVQLFNMVKQQQRTVEKSLKNIGSSIIKQDKVLESFDKKKVVESFDQKEEAGWDVLRDDFMGGTKIKNWDKKNENDCDQDLNY
ncbi:RRP15-like protein [Daktulosphaira vitifoliae]|uniref:RRP15-like protein n=1 Tax=Daktulosphaira vitifoliae TaxID=58002 RepID=UPI0021A9E2B2|nr:RRP15-like protein [Daktulosphaira vitifoliae]